MIEETVGSIAKLVGGEVVGDPGRRVIGVADLRRAGPAHVGFISDVNLEPAAKDTAAAALLVKRPVETSAALIQVDNVVASFARVAQHFNPLPRATTHDIHPTAVIADDAVLHEPVCVGPGSVVGAKAELGAGTIIGARVVIGDNCRLGEDCTLHPGVVLYPGVVIGKRVILHAGSVLGSDGFGYAQDDDGSHVKFPQMGTVIVGDDVEIGANTAVDRGALGATRIGRGGKIDNLVQVGHNCEFGDHVGIAGFSAFSGSAILGDRVSIGGHTVVGGHLRVGDDVRIGGNSVILRDVEGPGDFVGYPLQEKRRWVRTLRAFDRLIDMSAQVKAMGAERKNQD